MYRVTRASGKWHAAEETPATEEFMEAAMQLVAEGEIVILVDDLEDLEDMDIDMDCIGIPVEDIEVVS